MWQNLAKWLDWTPVESCPRPTSWETLIYIITRHHLNWGKSPLRNLGQILFLKDFICFKYSFEPLWGYLSNSKVIFYNGLDKKKVLKKIFSGHFRSRIEAWLTLRKKAGVNILAFVLAFLGLWDIQSFWNLWKRSWK